MTSSSERGGRPRGRPAGRVPLCEDRERHEIVILAVILKIAGHLRKHPTALGVFALLDTWSVVSRTINPGTPIEIISRRTESYARSRQKYLVRKCDVVRVSRASRCDAGASWLRHSVAIITAFLNGGADEGILAEADWRALLPELTMIRDVLKSPCRKIFFVAFYLELRPLANGCSLRLNDERSRPMRMAFQIDDVPGMVSLSRDAIDDAIRTGALVAKEAGGRQVVLTTDLQNFMDGLPPVRIANAKSKKGTAQ
ncbi:MAG: hypothetical protein JWM36_3213 [Hyphomicrobiales bacterium]|nr:hypothetical protein [Hyphomicrobiales bacterium]